MCISWTKKGLMTVGIYIFAKKRVPIDFCVHSFNILLPFPQFKIFQCVYYSYIERYTNSFNSFSITDAHPPARPFRKLKSEHCHKVTSTTETKLPLLCRVKLLLSFSSNINTCKRDKRVLMLPHKYDKYHT